VLHVEGRKIPSLAILAAHLLSIVSVGAVVVAVVVDVGGGVPGVLDAVVAILVQVRELVERTRHPHHAARGGRQTSRPPLELGRAPGVKGWELMLVEELQQAEVGGRIEN
jgi:hypothetical protein